jgi:hypothetical protein
MHQKSVLAVKKTMLRRWKEAGRQVTNLLHQKSVLAVKKTMLRRWKEAGSQMRMTHRTHLSSCHLPQPRE